MTPIFFSSPAGFGRWLARHHATEGELWVGFHRRATGRPSMTWSESVDEALCFGWIDGVRKSVDAERYVIRFTPRRPGSTWSNVNVRKAEALIAAGRMHPAGLAAYRRRTPEKTGTYAFEQEAEPRLTPEAESRFRANEAAWRFFHSQPPGYRRTALTWVLSAKREETRSRRLATLISDSAAGLRIAPLRRGAGPEPR